MIFSKKVLPVLLALGMTFSWAPASFAQVTYFPDVTAAMTSPDYWSAKSANSDAVLLTTAQIEQANRKYVSAKDTNMNDLKAEAATFDGIARNEAVVKSAKADKEHYMGWTFKADGSEADDAFYDSLIANCTDPKATRQMPVRYGIVTGYTLLRTFPSDQRITDDPADTDFDYEGLSAVRVNEPLLIYTTSADGKYYMAKSQLLSGWVDVNDVAICKDRNEWLEAWDIPASETLVVYGAKVYTETSLFAPEVSQKMLTQGTVLRSVAVTDPNTLVNNRAAYYNHVAVLPVRNADGSYRAAQTLISQSRKVSEGYLPMTRSNILKVAFECLGDNYGWGGTLDSSDCSGLICNIYSCFGLTVPRNTTWQLNAPAKKVDLSNMTEYQKKAALDKLPAGTSLFFPGHTMMYLGKEGGKYYVISNTSSVMKPQDGSSRQRIRSVMINTLDVKRANGRTWLDNLTKGVVLYQPVL